MVIATALCLAVHGCDSVTGGAVELSWKLRPASSSLPDKFVDCDTNEEAGPVTAIRLRWEVLDVSSDDEWPCSESYGVTRFDLPPGEARLSVLPICAGGVPASPNTYIAPAPERRIVNVGDTVSLGAVELIVAVSDCLAQPCICQ